MTPEKLTETLHALVNSTVAEYRDPMNEKQLVRLMRQYGYECIAIDNGFRLRALPIAGYSFGTIPQHFRSIRAAADWLCPIICDADYTEQSQT